MNEASSPQQGFGNDSQGPNGFLIPIVHMKKLRLSKVKEIAHGHPGENAGKIPPLAPLN